MDRAVNNMSVSLAELAAGGRVTKTESGGYRPYCAPLRGYQVRVQPHLEDKFKPNTNLFKFWPGDQRGSPPPEGEITEGYKTGEIGRSFFRSNLKVNPYTFILKENGVVVMRAVEDALELGSRHSSLPDNERERIASSGEFGLVEDGKYAFNLKSYTFAEFNEILLEKTEHLSKEQAHAALAASTHAGLEAALGFPVEFREFELIDAKVFSDSTVMYDANFKEQCAAMKVYASAEACKSDLDSEKRGADGCWLALRPSSEINQAVNEAFGRDAAGTKYSSKRAVLSRDWQAQAVQRLLLLTKEQMARVLVKEKDGKYIEAARLMKGIRNLDPDELDAKMALIEKILSRDGI